MTIKLKSEIQKSLQYLLTLELTGPQQALVERALMLEQQKLQDEALETLSKIAEGVA